MKLIQIKTTFFAITVLAMLGSCKKSFIDLEPKGQFLSRTIILTGIKPIQVL